MAEQTITPYLVVPEVPKLIEFLGTVFGGEVIMGPMKREDGSVMHAQVQIRDMSVMMGEPMADGEGMPAMLYIYVDDCDAHYEKAIAAGATSIMPPEDQPHGDHYCGIKDPCGNQWWIAQVLTEMDRKEIEQAYDQ